MEPRAHHLIIGLFTILAFAAALIFSLWLAKSSADRDWGYYEIVFDHAVGGLSEGNPVLYSGVQIGDVVELNLDPDNPGHVRVLVRVDQSVPIRENTRAGLVLANITGSMSVQFSGGSPDQPALKGDRDSPPVIMAEPSAFNNLLANGEQLLTKADRLLTSATELLSGDNILCHPEKHSGSHGCPARPPGPADRPARTIRRRCHSRRGSGHQGVQCLG